jgi:hypothetical protein
VFIRFVIQKNDIDSGRRQGLFQALSDLEHENALLPSEQRQYDKIYQWFRSNLKKPTSFSCSLKPHAKNVAISWFKDTVTEHIAKMRVLASILMAHGIAVELLKTERPGYVVYEDQHQVTAEPFRETGT